MEKTATKYFTKKDERDWEKNVSQPLFWADHGMHSLRAAYFTYNEDPLNLIVPYLIGHALENIIKAYCLEQGKTVQEIIDYGHIVSRNDFNKKFDANSILGKILNNDEIQTVKDTLKAVYRDKYFTDKKVETTPKTKTLSYGPPLEVAIKIMKPINVAYADEISSGIFKSEFKQFVSDQDVSTPPFSKGGLNYRRGNSNN